MKRLLVGCEESQVVCKAFRDIGWDAWSCDLKETSGDMPEYHIQADLIEVIQYGNWDMLIAFPPCTYLSNAGVCRLVSHGVINNERYHKGLEAVEFFNKLLNCGIPRICLENPVPSRIWKLPYASQKIDHFQFGSPYTKATYLWLRNLPILMSECIVVPEQSWVMSGYRVHSCDRQTARSKTCPGVALAMANQWGGL